MKREAVEVRSQHQVQKASGAVELPLPVLLSQAEKIGSVPGFGERNPAEEVAPILPPNLGKSRVGEIRRSEAKLVAIIEALVDAERIIHPTDRFQGEVARAPREKQLNRHAPTVNDL